MPRRRSQLGDLAEPDAFLWATGIEDTFITAPHPKTGRTLDEYALTEHYERCAEDLELMGQLGVPAARYGIPWHAICPAPGEWRFEQADLALEKLLDLGIEPIVDLVHYGLPPWIEGAWVNPAIPSLMAEWSRRVAERYAGRIRWYTPLNEPRITAWYCGRIGWWPPFLRGVRGFVRVMLSLCRGIVASVEALLDVDPENVICHVDATDYFESDDPALAGEVARRQEIVFLALDLVSGRLVRGHPLHTWLMDHGADRRELEWFVEHAVELPVIGLNMYPVFTQKNLARTNGRLRIRMPYAEGRLVEDVTHLYAARYPESLLMISETASLGAVARRRAWLHDSVAAVKRLRESGVPLVGYTWWPMFSLVTWAYRQGRHPPPYYLKHMGLWDLDDHLDRVPTALVDEYRALAAAGARPVGSLRRPKKAANAR